MDAFISKLSKPSVFLPVRAPYGDLTADGHDGDGCMTGLHTASRNYECSVECMN